MSFRISIFGSGCVQMHCFSIGEQMKIFRKASFTRSYRVGPLICLKWFGISRLHLLTGVPHMLHLFKHRVSSIWSYASDWKHSQFTSILCVTLIEVPLDWFHADPLWMRVACVSSEEINNINLSHCSNVILSPIQALSLSRDGGEIFHKANVNARWHWDAILKAL